MELNQKIEKTAEWIHEKVSLAGLKGVVVGLSGGIDSALAACLMKKAFPNNSLAVILPIKSSEDSLIDAMKLSKKINIDTIKIDLNKTHEIMFKTILEEAGVNKEAIQISDANLRARLRMSAIYTVASLHSYMVIGTDNAAEIYTGYFTKYGDGGCDILPLAPLLKREVYEWAEYLGVPESILKKAPSADLWESQSDENEMGTKYKYIDDFLIGKEIPEKDRLIIERLHHKTHHKRKTPEQIPKFE